MEKIRVSEILKATEGELIRGETEAYISGISTDSRTIKPGEVFLALTGERFDGHKFIEQVKEKGAGGVIISEDVTPLCPLPMVVRVKDTLASLGQIAAAYRQKFQIPVIAVTGSNGKTTTKEMIAAVLSQRFEVVKSQGSFNNNVGLPLTLLNIESTTRAVVLEIGMNHLGEIEQLAELAKPTIAVITNVGQAHIGNLGSQEKIAQAKAELIRQVSPQGMACLNRDDPYVWAMNELFEGKVVSFGLHKDALIRASGLKGDEQKIEFTLNDTRQIQIPVLGLYNVYNALAAVGVGLHLNLSPELIKEALAQFSPPRWRMETISLQGVTLINDAYNANPTSMGFALNTLENLPVKGKRVVVMGDMLELGDRAEELHKQQGSLIALSMKVDVLITVGELARLAAQQAMSCGMKAIDCSSNSEAATELQGLLQAGDCVLIKGSRRMKLEEIVEKLKG